MMKEQQQMVRVPWFWWLAFVEYGKKKGVSGAEVARDVMKSGAEVVGISLPGTQTTSASERKARKRERLKAELEALG